MKERKITRILSAVLAVVLFIGSFPIAAFAIESDAPSNVALGKSVSASSSFNEIYTPEKVTDGVKEGDANRWNSQKTTEAEWISVDLEDVYSISSIVITWSAWMNLAGTVVVSVSEDGKLFTEVGRKEDNYEVSSTGFEFSDETLARYIRLDLDKCPDVWGYSIAELEIFGELHKAAKELVNVALGKTATASSQYNEWYPAEKLLDGKRSADNERWNSKRTIEQEWVIIDLEDIYDVSRVYLEWFAWGNLAKNVTVSASVDGELYVIIEEINDNFQVATNVFEYDEPVGARYIRFDFNNCYSDWGYCLWEIEVYAEEDTIDPKDEVRYENLALFKTVTASSSYSSVFTPDKIVDGDTISEPNRWNSQGTRGKEWIEIDLETVYALSKIVILTWLPVNMASEITVSISEDGSEYKQVFKVVDNKDTENVITLSEKTNARYVRMEFNKCASDWGYSLREVEVFSNDHVIDPCEAEFACHEGNVLIKQSNTSSGGYYLSSIGSGDSVTFEKMAEAANITVKYSSVYESKISVYVDGGFACEVSAPKTEKGVFEDLSIDLYVPEGSSVRLESTKPVDIDKIILKEDRQNDREEVLLAEEAELTGAEILEKISGSYSGNSVCVFYGTKLAFNNIPDKNYNTIAIKYMSGNDFELLLETESGYSGKFLLPASDEFNIIYLRLNGKVGGSFTISLYTAGIIDTLELLEMDVSEMVDVDFDGENRLDILLDGVWECTVGNYEDTEVPEFFDKTIVVPGMWDLADATLGDDTGKSLWYQKSINLKNEIPDGQRVILRINKAYYGREVFINGESVGKYYYNFTASDMDITDYLNVGENKIQIKLGTYESGKKDPENPAHMGYDLEKLSYLPGIVDSVSLIINKNPYIDRVKTASDIDKGEIRVVSQIKNDSDKDITGNITIKLYELGVYKNGIPAMDTLINTYTLENITVNAGESYNIDEIVKVISFDKENKAWSPENPYLYRVVIETIGDSVSHRFGMRTFTFDKTSGKTLLNGEVYYLKGTNVCINRFYEDSDRSDHPWDEEWVRELFAEYQYVNWDGARFCIGFPPEFWYDICDEIGFLVVDEYPYWYCSEDELHDGCKIDDLAVEYETWIYERNNHPCVIFWDAQNESQHEYDLITAEVINRVRNIDIQKRAWENGWGPVQSSGDPCEQHYYPFIDLNYTLDKIGTGAFTLQASTATKFNYINEYGWLWVDREGNVCRHSEAGYKTGNRGDDPEEYKEFYALAIAQMTERFRVSRKYFGVFQFCGLSYSINDGTGYTSDVLSPDLSAPRIREEHRERMRSAFADVGIVIDDWGTSKIAGSSVKIPVVLVNDLNEEVTKNVTLTLYKNHSASEREAVLTLTKNITAKALSCSDKEIFEVKLPYEVGAEYTIIASYEVEGEKPIFSERQITLTECKNHVYDNDKDTTCNNCGETRELPKCENHVYDDDKDTTCNNCGEVRAVNTPAVTTTVANTTASAPVTTVPGVTTANNIGDDEGSPAIIIIVIIAVAVIGTSAITVVTVKKKRI
jgi:hypothetical protein